MKTCSCLWFWALHSHLFFADDLILFDDVSCSQAKVLKKCLDSLFVRSVAKKLVLVSLFFFALLMFVIILLES